MKKIVAGALALLVLAGCGSSAKKETKTCTQDLGGSMMSAKMDAEDDVIKTIDMSIDMPSSSIPYDISTLTDDQKKQLEDTLISSAGYSNIGEGMSANIEFNDDNVVIHVKIDITKTDAATLKQMNYTKDTKLSDTVKSAEASGATCK